MAGMMSSMMRGVQDPGPLPAVSRTVFREHRGVEIQEITDGTSNTIMVVEAAEAVPWTKPDELPFPEAPPLPRLGGSLRDGVAALFADGRVRLIDQRVEERVLRNLITPAGGEVISGNEFPHPDSPPPGGPRLGPNAAGAGATLQDESQRFAVREPCKTRWVS